MDEKTDWIRAIGADGVSYNHKCRLPDNILDEDTVRKMEKSAVDSEEYQDAARWRDYKPKTRKAYP